MTAVYFLLGGLFGVILTKAEVVSWFRVQEMFRFQAFHMYGVLASAVAVAALSVALLRWSGARTMSGDPIVIRPRELGKGHRYWIGGTIFGLGWALTGACPGPLFALFGSGMTVFAAAVAAALAGTWTYGLVRPWLPHY